MKVLVGCEYSQTVTKAFRERGYEAFSCDIEMFGIPRTPDYLSQLTSASIILSHGAYFLGYLAKVLGELVYFVCDKSKSKKLKYVMV